jgi:hypothetical protein
MSSRIAAYIRQHHLALVAIFFALSGTAYAVDGPLPGTNQVGSEDIIDAEVKTQDVANNAIGSGKIPDGAVRSADVANDTTDFGLTAQDLEKGSVSFEEVLDNSLFGDDIKDATLTGTDIAPASLTGAEVEDSSLTGADVGDSSLTGADVANSSLTGADVQNSSLTGSDIAPGSLTGSDIADTSSIGGAEIDESDLDISSLVFARDAGSELGQCDGLLSSSQEICADVSVTLSQPSRVFIVASGGWSKELGDPAESLCRIEVDDQDPPEHLLFMGDNTGFGGGHSAPRRAMPFTLNATTGSLDAGTHTIALKCEDNSSGDQDTLIGNARISALVVGGP